MVPSDALVVLCEAAGPHAAAAFARAIGESVGARIAARLEPVFRPAPGAGGAAAPAAAEADPGVGAGVRAAPVETVVDHLGGELALLGLGTLALERWGRAMVLVVEGSPLGPSGDRLLESVLEAALAGAAGRAASVVQLERSGARARFLVTGSAAASRVRSWLGRGMPWVEAIVTLHGAGAPPPGSRGLEGDGASRGDA